VQVRREDLYITSKLWNHRHRPEHVRACLDERLRLLRVGYLDLFLMHWPIAFQPDTYRVQRTATDPWHHDEDDGVTVLETWRAMEALLGDGTGRVRAIGVSNMGVGQWQRLVAEAAVVPATNQVECHPYLAQRALLAACTAVGSTLTAFSPLGKPGLLNPGQPHLLADPVVLHVAAKHQCPPSHVVLRWNMQRGVRVIPKSTHPARIAENYASGRAPLMLDADDMRALDGLDCGARLVQPHWVTFVEGEGPVCKVPSFSST
jgi:alcohol dehydrogenase (NADP+)